MPFSSNLLAADFKVTFINPGVSNVSHTTDGFWHNVSSFMKAAAEDLNIELEVLYAERNHIKLTRLVQEVANRKNKPNYLIIVNEMRQGGIQIKTAVNAGIKTFMMLNTLVEKDCVKKYGTPRGKYKNWIGTLIPDNCFAGYQIAKSIIDKALREGVIAKDGNLHIVGMAGDYVTPAAIERNKGLKNAVSEYSHVDLKQIFVCSWSKDKSRSKTLNLFKRYPEVGVIWAANDPIALGTMEAVVALDKKPGQDVYFGGLNWDTPALKEIQKGSLTVSMGGHFMTGGWVMVLLHDYHQGKDFAEEGTNLKMRIFDEINSSNVDEYLKRFGEKNGTKLTLPNFLRC
jgi:ABC-type sugar transport system substrate-binding protein